MQIMQAHPLSTFISYLLNLGITREILEFSAKAVGIARMGLISTVLVEFSCGAQNSQLAKDMCHIAHFVNPSVILLQVHSRKR